MDGSSEKGVLFWAPRGRYEDFNLACNRDERIVTKFLAEGHSAVQLEAAYLSHVRAYLKAFRNSHSL